MSLKGDIEELSDCNIFGDKEVGKAMFSEVLGGRGVNDKWEKQ